MRIEELKRWHWILISLFLGALMGAVWSSNDLGRPARSVKAPGFEQALYSKVLKGGEPPVKSIRIYPPTHAGSDGTQNKDLIYPVSYLQRTPTRDSKGYTYEPFRFDALTPFVPERFWTPEGFKTGGTVIDYLSALKKQMPYLGYTYAWWETPKWSYPIWIGSSFLVIGLIWPTILYLLVGAGLGRAPREKDEYDLSRFSGGNEDGVVGKPKEMTAADELELAAMTARLEASTASTAQGRPPVTIEGTQTPIRTLDEKPLPQDKPETVPKKREENREYRGEFYPTAREKKKKNK